MMHENVFNPGDIVRVDNGNAQYIMRYEEGLDGLIFHATERQKADWLQYTTENRCDAMPLISTKPIYNYEYTEDEEWEDMPGITILGGTVTININIRRDA